MKFFKNHIFKADELEDPKHKIDEECKHHHCEAQVKAYEDCVKRIEGKQDIHCGSWFTDLKSCIDHCVSFDKFF